MFFHEKLFIIGYIGLIVPFGNHFLLWLGMARVLVDQPREKPELVFDASGFPRQVGAESPGARALQTTRTTVTFGDVPSICQAVLIPKKNENAGKLKTKLTQIRVATLRSIS